MPNPKRLTIAGLVDLATREDFPLDAVIMIKAVEDNTPKMVYKASFGEGKRKSESFPVVILESDTTPIVMH